MSEAHNESLLSDSYKYQEIIVDNDRYLVGVCKKNDERHILLTNLTDFYQETLSKKDIVERCKNLNPVLIDSDFEEIVDNLLINIPKFCTSSSLETIQLESKIEDGRFWFNINLLKTSSEYFYAKFIENFYFSFYELYHRYNCLLDIVQKKDCEIAEYKAHGIELLRTSLVTEPFAENLFHTKLKNSKSVDKIDIFLHTMNFYNSLKTLKFDNTNIKQELKDVELEQISDAKQSPRSSSNNEKTVKRPLSSDVRCAVAPKVEKKAKVCKQGPEFKFL